MLEREIENHLNALIKRLGGTSYKMSGYKGVADRLVCLPNTPLFFMELKTDKGKLSPSQVAFIKKMGLIGHTIHVTYGLDQALQTIQKEWNTWNT